MASFAELLTSFSTDAGRRGKQFEQLVRWFLRTDPEWATQVADIWLWDEYPDRWGIDCGIDLVFRHKNGETWAVQAKCYSPNHDITKQDVDKFLSESNRKGIDKRLLIATTDRLGANAKQVCEAQEKTVVRYLLSNFESADIEYPASLSEIHKAKRKDKPTPREHQLEAIAAVTTNFQDADRGKLIMACGTGKTFTTLWIKEQLSANSTLVLLPSLGLLSQTLHEWTLAANQPFEVLCVCSDQTVGKKGVDEAIHSVADLAFPVTSDTAEIRRFLKQDAPKVIFSTYQSSQLIAEAQEDQSVQAFDLAIADEAHRCAGKVGSDFLTILDGNRIRATKRLFTTATPRTYSTSVKKAAEDRGVEVVGMDDEAVFGKVLYALPFGEAIRRNLLTDYRVVIIGVDNPTIAEWIQNRALLKTDSGIENDAESLAAQIGLLKAYKDYDLKRVISFHSRVARAESFSQDIQQVMEWVGDKHKPTGLMKTDFVSGAMPTDRRRRKLTQLKALGSDERGLLTNARCLSEGVDVPSLDGVAFIDPRSSQIDIIQAVGRAIRLSQNKTAGTIVLPVFIEHGDNTEESIEASNFKPIWEVLNALKAHDDVLSAELDQIRTELGRKAGSQVAPTALSKIAIDIPSSVDHSFGNSFRTLLVERVTESWEFWFGLLEAYTARHGNSNVPGRYCTALDQKLGVWVNHQRQIEGLISIAKRQRLERMPGWSWDVNEDKWDDGYAHLKEYLQSFGNCLVPADYISADGYKLGSWVAINRSKKKALSSSRVEQLEQLPTWVWDKRSYNWEQGFSKLCAFVSAYGHCRVSIRFVDAGGYRLGSWVNFQRTSRNHLTSERQQRLEMLAGWVWDAHQANWDSGFDYLDCYVKEHGTSNVPISHIAEDGFKLGNWIGNNRQKKSQLPMGKIEKLESLPGWSWNKFDSVWEEGFLRLKQFSDQQGHCKIPSSYDAENGFSLSKWVIYQRNQSENMPDEKRVRLEGIPGWVWNPLADQWEEGFKHLVEYANHHGHCDVAKEFKAIDGYGLGAWVTFQRKRRQQNKLSQTRIERLDSLTGWYWERRK